MTRAKETTASSDARVPSTIRRRRAVISMTLCLSTVLGTAVATDSFADTLGAIHARSGRPLVSFGDRYSRRATSKAHTTSVTTLTVGLYPWVPRSDQFQTAIQSAWSAVQPSVSLTFLPSSAWDGGYDMDPPASADVFVFDAMFLEYFQSKNYLEPLSASEVSDLADFVPYSIDGVLYGSQYFGIPQLGCSNILFYQSDDSGLAGARTLSGIKNVVSTCTYTSEIPPDRRGLMVDMSGGTTSAAMYLDALHSLTGSTPPLPWTRSQLDPLALANLQLMLQMASYENGTADVTDAYERAEWYSEGWGRGVVGFTESMSEMSVSTRLGTDIKVFPMSDSTTTQPYFYADVIGVNTTTSGRGTRSLAVQLANVMAATSTMVAAMQGIPSSPVPQFLMPTRPSIFTSLTSQDPMYGEMYAMVTAAHPVMFKVNSQSRAWLSAMKSTIASAIRSGYPCPCDKPATALIQDDTYAPAICTATCANYGGWNGQWTNTYPSANGMSVCGCKTCP